MARTMLIGAFLALLSAPAWATQFSAVRNLTCLPGRITDAAADGEGHVYLCYPDAGYVAQYDRTGKLLLNLRREAGVHRPFRPTSVVIGHDGLLLVFDEVSRELLEIGTDGNQIRSYPLAYPDGGQALALSRIGHLALDAALGLWSLLPDRGAFVQFDAKGNFVEQLDLDAMLPFAGAAFGRAQWVAGKLFVLDYNQGAVLYGSREGGTMRRLLLAKQPDIDAAPLAQDFAVDGAGRILILAADKLHPAVLLHPGPSGYTSSYIELPAGIAGKRLGCRPAGDGYVIWDREGGIVCLCKP